MSTQAKQTLLGRKIGMTQVFDEAGTLVPITVLEAGPCTVLQVKTAKQDGYEACQIAFDETKKTPTKPMAGVFKKAGCNPYKFIREIPVDPSEEKKPGDTLTVDMFEGVSSVNIVGTSKGKGFAGTIKRWNFSSGPRAHGCKNVREIGTSGSSFASRVFPGRHMPGQMGNKRKKIMNLKIVKIDKEKNLLMVKGAVPGPNGGYVYIEKSAHGK